MKPHRALIALIAGAVLVAGCSNEVDGGAVRTETGSGTVHAEGAGSAGAAAVSIPNNFGDLTNICQEGPRRDHPRRA